MQTPAKIVLVAAFIILTVGFFLWQGSSNTSVPEQGMALPDIVLADFDGNEVRLHDYIGTPLVVNAWASWCPFCVGELPDLAVAQKEFGGEVLIIAIDRVTLGETPAKARAFVEDLGIASDLVYLVDQDDAFYRAIGGFTMPETIFVSAEGKIIIHKRGVMPLTEIRNKINELLSS